MAWRQLGMCRRVDFQAALACPWRAALLRAAARHITRHHHPLHEVQP